MTHHIELDRVAEKVADLIDIPSWVDPSITTCDVFNLVRHGMGGITELYKVDPMDTLAENFDEISSLLDEDIEANVEAASVPVPDGINSLSDLVAKLLTLATIAWIRQDQVEDELTEIIESQLDMVASQWPEIRAMIVEQYSEDDEPALNEGFNDWLDGLHKDGQVCNYIVNQVCREDVE